MTFHITRRDFLKSSAAASSLFLVSGCTADLQKPVWMESYVNPPEETLPSENFWFASTCRMCPAGCGVIAKVSNGRVRKLEGNPEHPLNRGRLCARGQAGLQELYHPDRVQQALKRSGDRSQDQWTPLSWEQAIGDLAAGLQDVDPDRVAFLTGYLPHYQSELVGRFMKGLGTQPPVIYDAQAAFDGRVTLAAASQRLFDTPALPVFDISQADVVFGFGADFLETWLSPVAYSQRYGDMRGQVGKRGYFAAFGPRLSMTAASADRWLPTPPGTEGLAALALGKIIVDEGLDRGGDAIDYQALYQDVDVDAIAEIVEIPVDELTQLARTFAAATQPVALPGGMLSGHANGLDAVKAVAALNMLVGAGEEGGMKLTPEPPSRDLRRAPVSSFADVQALTARMANGDVDTLFVLGANPVYELPAALGFADALASVKNVVVFATLMTETAQVADLILPAHTYLETWGYEFVDPGFGEMTVSAQQPVVQPLYDTRDPGDALLALANAMDGDVVKRLPWPNLVNFIQTRLTSLQLLDGNFTASDTDTFWAAWLQHGGWWSQEAAWTPPTPGEGFGKALAATPPRFAGDAGERPFHLIPIPSVIFGDGRHAGLPWLQEAPDPMTTASWDTWVEINPVTAQQLGVANNDLVTIAADGGEITAIVYLYHGIRPDAVAVPVGQGHEALGRWASQRGANVLSILAPQTDDASGQLAWLDTRVQVTKAEGRRVLPALESNLGVERFRQQSL